MRILLVYYRWLKAYKMRLLGLELFICMYDSHNIESGFSLIAGSTSGLRHYDISFGRLMRFQKL